MLQDLQNVKSHCIFESLKKIFNQIKKIGTIYLA